MKRRNFLASSVGSVSLAPLLTTAAEPSKSSPPNIFMGEPLLAGPDAANMAILQALSSPGSGKAEISINNGDWQTILPERSGLVAFAPHVLKFHLPPLPHGTKVRYKISAWSVHYKNAYSIQLGEPKTTEEKEFRTLDPTAKTTTFAMWNDTHEQIPILRELCRQTQTIAPDFLLWNGDQTDDIYDPAKMARQFICPDDLPIARTWPMSYLRGNHDVRGPAARHLIDFTHCPGSDYTHAFRSGPVACLTMDTGEDKPDNHPAFAGMVNFDAIRQRQTEWLANIISQPWFASAPYKLLFCHIPLWWKEENSNRPYYWNHKPCRDAWLPLLEKGGIQLVISGHTHEDAHLPKDSSRPIAQLIGGGRTPETATLTTFQANDEALRITMKRLDGSIRQEVTIHPA